MFSLSSPFNSGIGSVDLDSTPKVVHLREKGNLLHKLPQI